MSLTRDDLARRDRLDPLARCRELFELPDGLLYLNGNSLGPPPRASRRRLRRVADVEWGESLVRSWNVHGWIDLPRRVAAKIAPLVGAAADEVTVADSTSVNLFKLLAAALGLQKSPPAPQGALRPERRTIVCEQEEFPTDVYVAEGLTELLDDGYRLRVVPGEELEAALDGDVAAVCLSYVQFKSGQLLDMAGLTRAAHDAGALAVWDLSHGAGALPVELGACGVDLAVGCTYKFLNGGPGSPAFLYVARRHHEAARSPLQGWMGHENPFAFDLGYRPAAGIDRFLCGTPPILSLAALDAALDVFAGVDMGELRKKSMEMGDLFLELVAQECAGFGLVAACPVDAARRGSQVSLRHAEAYALVQAAIDRGLVADFREPDVLRFGLAPLYLRYTDVWDAVQVLREVLATSAWDDPRYRERKKVT